MEEFSQFLIAHAASAQSHGMPAGGVRGRGLRVRSIRAESCPHAIVSGRQGWASFAFAYKVRD